MFNFFKKKIVEELKQKLYHCVICKGNYHREDIDFLESRKLSKIICVRCVEYIKKNSDINYKPLDLYTTEDFKVGREQGIKEGMEKAFGIFEKHLNSVKEKYQ